MNSESMQRSPSRLVLGTAQLGLNYGVANKEGKPSLEQAIAIVKAAWDGGIRCFDTARAYGDSEAVLGEALREIGIASEASVISKFPVDQAFDEKSLRTSVEESLERIQVSSLSGMLFHREAVVDSWDEVSSTLGGLRSDGLVGKFGVTCYEPRRAETATTCSGVELLQIPFNLFDRRFCSAGIIQKAQKTGLDVYVRSVFLQGLLVMHSQDAAARIAPALEPLRELDQLSQEFKIDKDMLALCYVRDSLPGVSVLIGAESVDQVERNLQIWGTETLCAEAMDALEANFKHVEESVIRPDLW